MEIITKRLDECEAEIKIEDLFVVVREDAKKFIEEYQDLRDKYKI